MVPSDRTNVNGHKLKHSRLPPNTKKHFFLYEGEWALVRVAQRGGEVSIHGDMVNILPLEQSGHDPGQHASPA